MNTKARLLSLSLVLVLLLAVGPAPQARPAVRATSQTPDETKFIQITHIPGADYSDFSDALISGNGRKVVYADESGVRTLYLANADGSGTPYSFADKGNGESVRILDISYDGKKVLYYKEPFRSWDQNDMEDGDGLYIYDADADTRTRILPCYHDPRISQYGMDEYHCLIPHPFDYPEATLSGDGKYVFFFASVWGWDCSAVYEGGYYGYWKWSCRSTYDGTTLWRIPVRYPDDPSAAEMWADMAQAVPNGGRLYDSDDLNVDHFGDAATFDITIVSDEDNSYLPEAGIYLSTGPGRFRQFTSLPPLNEGTSNISPDGDWIAWADYEPESDTDYYYIYRKDGSQRIRHPHPPEVGNFIRGISEDGQSLLLESFAHSNFSYELWLADREGNLTHVDPGAPGDSKWVWYGSLSYGDHHVGFSINIDDGTHQYFVSRGIATPDLAIDEFELDATTATYSDGKYILPVDVTVRNAGEATAADFQVRFSDNGGWSDTQNIASLAPDAGTDLHVDWDITDILKAGDGKNTVRLTVTADPDDEIVESSNLNNTTSASTEVDARPRILKVRPQFRLASAYFLNNQSVNNPVKVLVDWNGDLSGNGDAPYGDVTFNLNGEQSQESGQQWGVQHAYDMGDDFKAEFSCANNTLQIWAANDDFESLKISLQPTVFPFPGWVEWAINNIPGSDTSFKTEPKAPLVAYSYGFKYPEPSFEATWEPDDWVPYLGGQEIGIEPTQAEANATGHSDGAGTAGVAGNTGLALAAFTSEGNLWGQGEAQFVCGESLDLTRAEMGFSIHATVEQEAGLTDVIPAVKAAEDWPVVGRVVRWVNQIATVKGSFTPGVEIETEFEEQGGQLEFVHGEGTGSLDARAELATEVCEDLTASAYGGGTPYVTVQVPAVDSSYLKEVGIDLYYGAKFQAWEFEEECERKVNCNYPGGCEEVESQGLTALAHDEPTWRLIPRLERAPTIHATGALLQATSTTTETALVSPVYARPEPALTVADDGTRLLAYVDDDASDPDGRHTEIRARIWDGGWSGTDNLTNDEQPDFAPAVAFDGSGNGLAIWERSTLLAGITPSLNITFVQSLEIAASTWDGSSWSAPVTLTNDGLMDFAPRLSSGSDGSVMALWRTNDGTDMLGTAAHPLTYTYALWDGTGWLTPTAALTGLHDVVGTAFAAYSSTQAALVYAVDADGVLSTTADADLYYSTFDGAAWSGPAALATDAITDTAPALAYDANGKRHLLWLRGDDLVELTDSWNIAEVETVRASSTEGGFLGFTLGRDPNGNLSAIWQTMDAEGANLAYSVYDAAHDSWGADQTLMSDADVEAAHNPAFADGSLYLAYQKIETEFVTKTLSGASGTFTVTNVPTPGVSSLVFLEHTVGRDLTFDSLTVSPTNPAPGQQVTLTTVLRNAGDLAVAAPQVAFYDNTSGIITRTLPITLTAGTTTTLEANWTVPSAAAHTLKVIADPNARVTETDETNNGITTTTTLPDLQVDVLYTDHSSQAITVTARLTNAGVLTTGAPFDVAFRAADPVTGTLVATATVSSAIAAGGQCTVTQALTDPASLVSLGRTLWAVADDGDAVVEADEKNNTAYAALGALPDLTLAAGDVQGSGPLAITVHNAGIITATGATLAVHQGALTGTLLYSDTLGDLGPGAVQTTTLSPAAGQLELWVKVDPNNLVAESDEGNNLAVREVEIPNRVYLPLVMRSQ